MSADFGPQTPWPVTWGSCDLSTASPAATGTAVDFATDVLWGLTGMRFGLTRLTLRPCRRQCRATSFPGYLWDPWPGSHIGMVGQYPAGWGVIGAGCSACGDSCSCTELSEIALPAPVNQVVTVKVDGVVLTGSGVQYRVDDNRILVRTDTGRWPYCQNLRLPDTEVGTFSVAVDFGEDVPSSASVAVGQLACEVLKGLGGQDCSLPPNIVALARQGVSISMADISTIIDERGLLGLRFCDMFIHTFNPGRLKAAPRVYSVDDMLARRPT
jgi:hypothetical protein